MALKGKLEDFPIGNILQMIFMEKKSGVLSVKSGKDTLRFFFKNGKILLGTHDDDDTDERRIRLTLINNNYITEEKWKEVKNECDRTLKPIFIVLKNYIDKEILNFLIKRQVMNVSFEMFQWVRGEYTFNPDTNNRFDNIFKPIKGEFILMDGYRAIDEWREIIKKLPPLDSKLCSATNLDELLSKTGYQVTDNENHIILLTSKTISLEDILDSSMVDFSNTGKAVANLLSLGLINIIKTKEKTRKEPLKTYALWNWKGQLAAMVIIVLVLYGLLINYSFKKKVVLYYHKEINWFKNIYTKEGLNRVVSSIKYYYSMHGEIPPSVNVLIDKGYLRTEDAKDLWGRPFIFKISDDSFILYSKGPNESNPTDNIKYDGSNSPWIY